MTEMVTAADCPRCGCNDIEVVQHPRADAWFARGGVARCRHCGLSFGISDLPPLPEPQPAPAAAVPYEPFPPIATLPAVEVRQPIVAHQEPGVVVFHAVRCPACRSKETKVTTRGKGEGRGEQGEGRGEKVRSHKCQDCGHAFRSIEADE